MAGHRTLPDWRYGDILRYVDSRYPEDTTRAMFLDWAQTSVYDPNESIPMLLVVKTSGIWSDAKVGDVLKPYCGWWDRTDE